MEAPSSDDRKTHMEHFVRMNSLFPRAYIVFYIDIDPKEAYRRINSSFQPALGEFSKDRVGSDKKGKAYKRKV